MQSYVMIKPRRVALMLVGIVLILTGISLVADYVVEVQYAGSTESWLRLIDLFSVNLEESIPTWFSTILLYSSSLTLGIIALAHWRHKQSYRSHWVGLAVIFLYLSMDEGSAIHEIVAEPLQVLFNTGGYLYFGWQLLAVPLVILFVLIYIPFLFGLPARTRYGFMIAGAIYVGGAVVVEGFSADLLFNAGGTFTYPYLVTATIEECMEMLGIVSLIYVLLDYMVVHELQFALFSKPSQAENWIVAEDTPIVPKSESDWLQRYLVSLQDSVYAQYIMAFVIGFILAIVGWISIRELSLVTRLPNPAILLITIYLAGFASTYIVNRMLKGSLAAGVAVLLTLLYVSLPIWIRFLSSVPPLATGLVMVSMSIFVGFSLGNTHIKTSLMKLAINFVGLILGWTSLTVISQVGIFIAMMLITGCLLIVLWLLKLSGKLWFAMACLISAWVWFFPFLNGWSNTGWYQQNFDTLPLTTTAYTDYSMTQKFDVLDDAEGNRYLFVDGEMVFNPTTDRIGNIIKGRIPASLLELENTLVIGASSMQMELLIANYAGHVTTIEPNEKLAEISRDFFTTYNFMDRLENRTIEIGDVIPYLQSATTIFDFIAVDMVDGSFSINDLIPVVKPALTEDGLFAMQLDTLFTPANQESFPLVETLLETFDTLIIVNIGDTSYVYASNAPPFSRFDLQIALDTTGEAGYAIFEADAIRAIVGAG